MATDRGPAQSTINGLPDSRETFASVSSSHQGTQSSVGLVEASSNAELLVARNAMATNAPSRVRRRRKRVAKDLNEWSQLPSYLKDNE